MAQQIVTIPKGTRLYHGTHTRLPGHMPSFDTNWFSTDMTQALLWVPFCYREQYTNPPICPPHVRMYTYIVENPIPSIVSFKSIGSIAPFLHHKGFEVEDLDPYDRDDSHLALLLCKKTKYNGWMNPMMKQVMLCHPSEFLKPIERHELKMPIDYLKKYMHRGSLEGISWQLLFKQSQEDRDKGKAIKDELKHIEKELNEITKASWKDLDTPSDNIYDQWQELVGHDKRPYIRTHLETGNRDIVHLIKPHEKEK